MRWLGARYRAALTVCTSVTQTLSRLAQQLAQALYEAPVSASSVFEDWVSGAARFDASGRRPASFSLSLAFGLLWQH